MIVRRAALAASGLAALAVLPGCETTADKSARLAAQATTSKLERGLRVAASNPDVQVLGSAAITDANGTAVVVTLRDTARVAMADVPIAIDVRSAAGTSIFRNDQPGAEAALVSAPLLSPGRDFNWVHDQVQAAGAKAARVTVRVGKPRGAIPARPARMTAGRLTLESDGAGGTEGRGRLQNRSSEPQRAVTVYAVARRGSKVVAAGRALVDRVAAGAAAPFAIYFIGDPKGARISVSAAPAVSE